MNLGLGLVVVVDVGVVVGGVAPGRGLGTGTGLGRAMWMSVARDSRYSGVLKRRGSVWRRDSEWDWEGSAVCPVKIEVGDSIDVESTPSTPFYRGPVGDGMHVVMVVVPVRAASVSVSVRIGNTSRQQSNTVQYKYKAHGAPRGRNAEVDAITMVVEKECGRRAVNGE